MEYMKKILNWEQKEKWFKNLKWKFIQPLFEKCFTQLVLEEYSGEIAWILDVREYLEEWCNYSYLNVWRIFVDEKFKNNGIASQLYKNLEEYSKLNNIYKIISPVKKKNIASCNLHEKMWYKIVDSNEKENVYCLNIL